MKHSLQVVLVLSVISSSFAAIFFDDLKSEMVFGQNVTYCEYKGLRLLPRSKINIYGDCSRCTCRPKTGLTCATMFRLIFLPDDHPCKVERIRCKNVWLLRDDDTRRCPEALKPVEYRRTKK